MHPRPESVLRAKYSTVLAGMADHAGLLRTDLPRRGGAHGARVSFPARAQARGTMNWQRSGEIAP
ncbi:hypothetical protein KXV85_011170, partial [Aspergillus fumigatus]